MAHNVFISWSGGLSRSVASAVHEWLPTVIQAVDPFMSEKDIDAGARGLAEIATQLESIKIGVICLTAENQNSPWLNFEAGALSKLISNSYVIPLSFDLEKGQIKQPLGQFQAKQFAEDEMRQVVGTINKAIGSPLKEERLTSAFSISWPLLATKVDHIRTSQAQQYLIEEPKRSTEDMLEELIVSAREHASLLRGIKDPSATPLAMDAQLTATQVALLRLGAAYSMPGSMAIRDLMIMGEKLDAEDWKIINTAPFLVWYLDTYYDLRQPQSTTSLHDDVDDVPF